MKYSYCECGYKTVKHPRFRDLNKQITEDGGKWVIYMNKDNICPKCKKNDTLKFVDK